MGPGAWEEECLCRKASVLQCVCDNPDEIRLSLGAGWKTPADLWK